MESKKQRQNEQDIMAKLNAEIREMDKLENSKEKDWKLNDCQIEVFPIGNFRFPYSKLEIIFDIFNIENEEVKENLNSFFSNKIVPIINVFYEKIEQEGYQEGHDACKSLMDYERLYRRRKFFFENNFFRI